MKAAVLLILLAAGCNSSVSQSVPPGGPASAVPSASPSTSANIVHVNVTLSAARPMPEVVRDLEQRGLTVERRLTGVGVVTGRAAPDALPALRSVNGVKAVELDVPIQLAPEGKPQ